MSRRQAGFTLIELMVGIALLAVGLMVYAQMAADSARRHQEALAAQHMRQVLDGAERYIDDNNAVLRATATASSAAVLSVATLRTANYLPNQFTDLNQYRQGYEIRVLQPSPGVLSTLIVTTGGDLIGEGSLRRIARQIGAAGGYVSSSSSSVATGAYQAWSQPLSAYGASNGAGRIAASLFFREGQQVTDFLYRAAVAGRPDVNSMATSLNMGNNAITNAGGVTASGLVQAGSVTSSGRVSANEFILLGTAVTVGTSCSPVGLIGREADGRLASCVSGTWRRAGF